MPIKIDHKKLHTEKYDSDTWDYKTAKQWESLTMDADNLKEHLLWLKRNDSVVFRIYDTFAHMGGDSKLKDKVAVVHLARMVYGLTH
jgi:hypothetical protein